VSDLEVYKSTMYGWKFSLEMQRILFLKEWAPASDAVSEAGAQWPSPCAKITFVTRTSTLLVPVDDCLSARVPMSTFVCKMSIVCPTVTHMA
jgi:hypothetical protein